MRHADWSLCVLALLIFALGAGRAAAGELGGWRLKVSAALSQPTGGGGFDRSAGPAIALEYRASRHLGVELGVETVRLESEVPTEVIFVGAAQQVLRSRFRATPVLARLDWHPAPGRRADFYLGPVAGWVRYGTVDVELRQGAEGGGIQAPQDVEADDGFAWGVHGGLDLPFGDRGWFFTSGLTFLEAKVEPAVGGFTLFDLDPLVVHAGLGWRF